MKNINKICLFSVFLLSNYRFEAQTSFGDSAGAQLASSLERLAAQQVVAVQQVAAAQREALDRGANFMIQSRIKGQDLVLCGFQASLRAQSDGSQLELSAPGRVINEFGENFSNPWVRTISGAPRFEIGVDSSSDASVGLDLGDFTLENGQELAVTKTDGSQVYVTGSLRLNRGANLDATDVDSWSGANLVFDEGSSASFNDVQAYRSFVSGRNSSVYARSGLYASNANISGSVVVGDPYENETVASWNSTFALNAGGVLRQYGAANFNLSAGFFAGEYFSSGAASFKLNSRLSYEDDDSIYGLTRGLPLKSGYTYFDQSASFRAGSLGLDLSPKTVWDSRRTVLTTVQGAPLNQKSENLRVRYSKSYFSTCGKSNQRFESSVNYVSPEYDYLENLGRASFAPQNLRF